MPPHILDLHKILDLFMPALPPWKDMIATGAVIASPSAKCQPRCLEKEITPLTPHTARIYSSYQYPAPHRYDAVTAPIFTLGRRRWIF